MTPAPLPEQFPFRPAIVFTDVDETLTWEGRLPPAAFNALVKLQAAGIKVIPVTGASAGWCDCMIRTWPIDSIIGENGSFFISRNAQGQLSHTYALPESDRQLNWQRLQVLKQDVLARFVHARETADQSFRKTDIAFDIGQDWQVERKQAAIIAEYCSAAGFNAKMSSIHINVWCGNYSKSAMALRWLDHYQVNKKEAIFIGDSPNDDCMFASFPVTVAVANIAPYIAEIRTPPTYLTSQPGGFGFSEMSDSLLRTEAANE
ncbi:MAG: HAD-IIB family hydrolase [Gammaproteobacteria bacterium]|nr:HAD-IIB family hydrolase [Gammaproteobacteria bacterium]